MMLQTAVCWFRISCWEKVTKMIKTIMSTYSHTPSPSTHYTLTPQHLPSTEEVHQPCTWVSNQVHLQYSAQLSDRLCSQHLQTLPPHIHVGKPQEEFQIAGWTPECPFLSADTSKKSDRSSYFAALWRVKTWPVHCHGMAQTWGPIGLAIVMAHIITLASWIHSQAGYTHALCIVNSIHSPLQRAFRY